MKFHLRNLVHGYDELEPCILTAIALRRNIFMSGAHGIGKSTLGKLLAKAVDETGNGFRYFSADKANIITLGGLPDIEATKKSGTMAFAKTDKCLWGAKIILADELPRADKERQNYWLEICEEKSFQGIPIGYETLIATGNDVTYKGNFDLDAALASRFIFWLPTPKFDDIQSEDVKSMIGLNIGNRRDLTKTAHDIRDLIQLMRDKIDEYLADEKLVDQVSTFIGVFTQWVKEKISYNKELSENPDSYISPREFANQLIYAIFGLNSYYDLHGYENSLQEAGAKAIKYVIETRHAAAGIEFTNICNMAWKQLQGMLCTKLDTPEGNLKWLFAASITPSQKVSFWREKIDEAVKVLNAGDLTFMTGETLQQIRQDDVQQIGPFWHLMMKDDKTKHIGREIEGYMITEVARKLLTGKASAPGNEEFILYNKYGNVETLSPSQVAEILK